MEFVQNKGQWDKKVNYRGDFSNGSFFLENKGFTVLMHKADDLIKLSEYTHSSVKKINPKENIPDTFTLRSAVYKVSFLGANNAAERIPDKVSLAYNNYFIGNDPSQWAGNCKIFGAVTYKNIYPNIDLRYYSDKEQLKYDFIVRPGGNPASIAMRYDGATSLSVKEKELIVQTSVGNVKELAPYSYQTGASGSSTINTKYVVRDNVVTFNVDKYDNAATLVIDPQIIFASLSGSTSDNWGYTATPGPDGSFFAGGISFASGFPVSPGAYQTIFNGGVTEGVYGGVDIAIFKFSPDGSQRIYATYLGGNGNEQPHSMIADAAGNLIVAGRSNSSNYPKVTNVPADGANFDIIVTKFNAAGSALLGSVKIGGSNDDGVNIRPKYLGSSGADRLRRNYGDDARSEVILDASNNVYLASCTQSNNFPVLLPAQRSFGGVQDGVILKFTPNLSGLLFSTYFGGANDDACFVASINPTNQNLYIGGATSSINLPGNTTGSINATFQGDIDGFVTILPQSGTSFLQTTYLGTAAKDLVYGLKFDKVGFPYVMGTSTGSMPVLNAGFQNAGSKQFISKLKPDLSAYVYSTVFGKNASDPSISPIAFLVDRCENVYVSGWGGGINVGQSYSTGNTAGLPEVNPLSPIPAADGKDFYFFVLKKDASSQLFGSHYGENGGNTGDHVDGGTSRFDANGVIYQAICANCQGRISNPQVFFPATANAWARINGGIGCNQGSVKIEMNFAGIGSEIQSSIDGDVKDTVGCIPLTVNFKDLQQKGVKYYWNFNSTANPNAVDTITTNPAAVFTFNTVGTFRIRLISEDSSTCNVRDTSYITITAGDNKITPSFTKLKLPPCDSTIYRFTNTSSSTAGSSFTSQSFVWDYGDGSPLDTAGLTPDRLHRFPGPGSYFVKLTVIDPRFCNAPVTLIDTLRINSAVVALPAKIALGCIGDTIKFKNNSLGGLSWSWHFGDPASGASDSSNLFEPTHIYNTPGSYIYYLIAYDSTTCNKVDTSDFFTIIIKEKPQALFTWAPNPPEPNVPVRFTNLSTFADTYFWEFGDGETSTAFAPVHEYNTTGKYIARLTASSKAGCIDMFDLPVDVIINPLLDVPNAFTPGRFGLNSVVNVRGFGITKMNWRIYNRWGQLIFQSTSKREGWDGTFKGKLQPIDVYAYTLDAELSDGKKIRKTGDITLLR